MSSVNKVILLGHVGKDPEIRSMQSGKQVASFSIATTEKWKKDGESQEKTQWTNVSVFNEPLVNLIEKYVKKGSKIYVEGALETRTWDKDGVKQYTTEVVLKPYRGEIVLLSSKEQETQGDDIPGTW